MQNRNQIGSLDTFSVLHPVVRAKKLKENYHFDGDTLESSAFWILIVVKISIELLHNTKHKMLF